VKSLNPANTILEVFKVPQVILDKHAQLNALVEENPLRIPVKKAAEFMGMNESTLREMIDEGRCTFALGMQKSKHRNRYSVIPTYNFYMWQTQWALIWMMALRGADGFMEKGI
jgi:hypothetical protein